jgi:hypothetical protein
MEWVQIIIGFVTGGGLMVLTNYKINKSSQKVDFADKAMIFMEKENDKYIKRIEKLEEDVKKLFQFKCTVVECKLRQPPKM